MRPCRSRSSFTEEAEQRLHAAVAKRLTSLNGDEIATQHETAKLESIVGHLQRLGLKEHQIVKHIELMPKPKPLPKMKIDNRTGKPIEVTRLRSFKRRASSSCADG